MKKICRICLKEIGKNENYLEAINWNNNIIVEKRYFHKTCNDGAEIQKEEINKMTKQAKVMMNTVGGLLNKFGLTQPQEEYIIK
jgi:hypothetical protein